MKQPLILLSLIASLSAGAGLAQTADGGDPATPPAESGLDLGRPTSLAPDAPADQPQPYVKETYNDWSLQCIEVEADRELCQMYQLLKDSEGTELGDVYIFKVKDGGQAEAAGFFTVPLATLLPAMLTMQVDSGEAKQYEFYGCTQQGCLARVGFTAEDVARFKAGAEARIIIRPMAAPDRPVELTMSLSGFTAAYDETTAR